MRRLTLFLVLVLLTAEASVVSGQQPAASASPSPSPSSSPLGAIPLTKVQSEAQQAGVVLSQIDEKVARDHSAVEAASAVLGKLSVEIESRLSEDTKLLGSSPSLDLLFRLIQTWQEYGANLSTEADELTKRASILDDEVARLAKLREVWQATLRLAKEPNTPPLVLQRVQKIVDSIEQERQRAESARDAVITLLSRISAEQSQIQTTLSSIKESQNRALRSVSRRDSLPIWSLRANREWGQRSKQVLDSELSASTAFSLRLPATFLIHALSIILIAAAIRWMASKVRQSVETDPDLARARPILALPVSAAFTLCILGLPTIYPQAPRLIQALMGALTLIPVLRILRKLLEPPLLPILDALVATYFVSQVRLLGAALPELVRFVFLAQLAGVSLFLVWLIRNPLMHSAVPLANSTKIIRLVAKIGLVLLPLAFLANALGYANLGNLVATIYFRSIYLGAAMYAAIRIIEGLMVVVLHLGPIARLRIVRRHRTMLQHRTVRALTFLAVLCWLSLTLNFFGLRAPLIQEISTVLTAKLTVGSLSISLSSILAFVVAIWASFVVSGFLRFLLEEDVYYHFKLSRGIPYAISTMLHYVILLLGFFVALSALGIDLTKITILAGAFSVGVGFGLQNIINNFVSGLILLFERPIKIGDVIEVGGHVGEVRRIGIRASVIGTADGSEVIVPNGSFISGQVTNWTFSDRRRAVEISFNVANVGKPERIVELLKGTAANHPGVAKEPPPEAFIQSLAAASFAVQLRVWTESYQDWAQLRSNLLLEVNEVLAREKITLA